MPEPSVKGQFSTIYVEREASVQPETRAILERLGEPGVDYRLIEIDHYGDIFNRPRQHFIAQKNRPSLILAVERKNFLYRGNERINSWNQGELYYNAMVRNCMYNCEYCFLQGMHASAHTVLFVNTGDFIGAARNHLDTAQGEPAMYLSISYLSEILAFEPIHPYVGRWLEFAQERLHLNPDKPDFALEVRTKSDYYHALSDYRPAQNVYLVWSMSPEPIARRYERGCPGFQNRLFAASRAAADGWPVKLTIDPVIPVEGWRELYGRMIDDMFRRIPAESVAEMSTGVFRLNPGYLKTMQKLRPDSQLLSEGLVPAAGGGPVSYSEARIDDIRRWFEDRLSRYLPDEKIFFVHG